MATHSSVLPWRIPGIGKPDWAAISGVAQSQTWLKWLSSSSSRELRSHMLYKIAKKKMFFKYVTTAFWKKILIEYRLFSTWFFHYIWYLGHPPISAHRCAKFFHSLLFEYTWIIEQFTYMNVPLFFIHLLGNIF